MKKILFLISIFQMCFVEQTHAQFVQLDFASSLYFRSADILSPSEIFLASQNYLYTSSDGGNSFSSFLHLDTTVTSGSSGSFSSPQLEVESWNNAFVLDKTILTNGFRLVRSGYLNGKWGTLLDPSNFVIDVRYREMTIGENQTIIAVGDNGSIIRSIDNGTTWTQQIIPFPPNTADSHNNFHSVSYMGNDTWIVGGYQHVYKSTDNGITWIQKNFDDTVNTFISDIFVHENLLLASTGSYHFMKSIDAGETWTKINTSFWISYMFYLDEDIYLAIPGGNDMDRIYKTYDGGDSWEYIMLPTSFDLQDVNFYDADHMIMCGNNGVALMSSTGPGPSLPYCLFTVTSICTDEYIQIDNFSSYNIDYTYEWIFDGQSISNDYNLTNLESTEGEHTLVFNVNTGTEILTYEETFNLVDPPIAPHIYLDFTSDSICYGSSFSSSLEYRTWGAQYSITNASGFVTNLTYDGSLYNYGFNVYGDTYFTINATSNNSCRTVTSTEVVNITCLKPDPLTTFFLPADTVCIGQGPFYLGVANSDPEWKFGYSTSVPTYYPGNSDTLLIPFNNTSTNAFTVYLKAAHNEEYCSITYNLGQIKPLFPNSVLIVTPEIVPVGEDLGISLFSNYLEHHWDLGPDGSPQSFEGWPFTAQYLAPGRDTIQVMEIFADSSCQTSHERIVNCVEYINPQEATQCYTSELNRSTQTIDSKIDLNGNRIFTGYYILNDGIKNLFLRKEDSFGNLIFEKVIENGLDSYGIAVETDSLNNIYLVGQAELYTDLWGTNLNGPSFLIRFTQQGQIQWVLNNDNTIYLNLIISGNEIYTICEYSSIENSIYFDQIGGPNYPFNPPFGYSEYGSIILRYALNGQISSVYPFGISTSNTNINIHQSLELVSTSLSKYPKMEQLDNRIVIAAVCSPLALNHTYLAGSNILDNQLFTNVTEENSEFLLLLNLDTDNNELNGGFYISAQDLDVNDIVILENSIFTIADFANSPYSDRFGEHILEYPDTERLDYMLKSDYSGTALWSRIENTSHYSSIEKSGPNEFIGILQSSGESSFLSTNTNYGYTTDGISGSIILKQNALGEISELYQIDDNQANQVQSLAVDACGNAVISAIHHPSNNDSQVQVFSEEHIWISSKVGFNNCTDYCSASSSNQTLDLALLNLQLVTAGLENNEANCEVIVQNTGSETINSALIEVSVNGQILSINFAGNLIPGEISEPIQIGIFDLSGFSLHHQIATIQEVNGLLDQNLYNNVLQNSNLICTGPLSGEYTLATANAEFNTFQQTSDALQACGVSGDVTFLVTPGTYFGQLFIEQFESSSSQHHVTWISETNDATDVLFNFDQIFADRQEHVFLNDSVSHITFQSITFIDSISYDQESIVLLGNQCNDITLNKCVILGSPNEPQIHVDSPVSSSNSDIILSENSFYNGFQGLRFEGNNQIHDENVVIEKNDFHNQQFQSVNFSNINNTLISQNLFLDSLSYNILSIQNNTGNLVIDYNHLVSNQDSTIYIENFSGNQIMPFSSHITNNFITTWGENGDLTGLAIKNVSDLGIWFNTLEKNVIIDNCQRISMLNNIIGNSEVILDVRSSISELDIDFNQYYPRNGTSGVFSWPSLGNLTFETWKISTELDANSIILIPYLTSQYDSHIVGQFSVGTTLPWIENDIDEDTRSAVNPIIGADEPGLIPHQIYVSELVEPSCYGYNDGEIHVVALSAEGTSTFLWSDGFIGSNRTNLTAGSYSLTSEDENGEVVSYTVLLSEPEYFDIEIIFDTICFTGQNATAFAQSTTGVISQSLLWNTGDITNSISNLDNGEYWIEATSLNGCFARDTVQFVTVPFQIIPANISQLCVSSDPIAAIDIEVQGGLGNYSYAWNTGETTQDISGLAYGNYDVIVEDGQGCQQSYSQEIYYRMAISLNNYTQCFDPGTGTLSANIMGGEPDYDYFWNTGHTGLDLTDLNQGLYTITATDQLGCTVQESIYLKESLFTLTLDSVHYRCTAADTSGIFVTLDNFDAIEWAAWSDQDDPFEDNIFLYNNSTWLTVIDTLGCIQSVSAYVHDIPVVEIFDVTDCFNGNNGTLQVVQDDYYADSLIWSTGGIAPIISAPANGTYTVDLYYGNGCHITESFEFDRTPLEIVVASTVHPICWYDLGSINIEVQGGIQPMEYQWSNQSTSADIYNLNPGNYTLNVWDGENCNQELEITINPPLSLPYSFNIDGILTSYLDSTHVFTTNLPNDYSMEWEVEFCDIIDTNEDSVWVNFDQIGFALLTGIATDMNGCQAEEQIDVFVEEYIGVIENNNFQISAYPNPACDLLSIISNHGKPIEVRMLDSNGRLVQIKAFVNRTSLDVQYLAFGNYNLVFSENGKVIDQKKVIIGN